MLGIKQRVFGHKSASVSDAIDDAQTDSFDPEDGQDKLPDAGLMAAYSQYLKRQHGWPQIRRTGSRDKPAEDMKQAM